MCVQKYWSDLVYYRSLAHWKMYHHYTATGQMIISIVRTQPLPGHTMGILHFRKLFRMPKQLGESEAMFRQNLRSFWAAQVNSEATLGHKIGSNQEHVGHEGSIQDFVILRKQIAIQCSSISKPLCIFSTRFAIENSTFGTDTFQVHLHPWDTDSSC